MKFYVIILKKNKVFIFLLTFLALQTQGQNLGNSPYSRFALGDLIPLGFSNANGMGGVGVSYNYLGHINNLNPALIARQSPRRFTKFEAGVLGQLKQLNSDVDSQQDFAASLHYLSLAFPVTQKWSSAIGLSPLSSINYENTFRGRVDNSDFLADFTFQGRGGISMVYWTNAFNVLTRTQVNPKNPKEKFINTEVLAGLKINYLFGSLINERKTRLFQNTTNDYLIVENSRTQVSDFTYEPGILFRQGITYQKTVGRDSITQKRITEPAKVYLAIGAVASLGTDLNATRFQALERRNINDLVIDSDTISEETSGTLTLPVRYSFGVSIENEGKWTLATDISLQDWSSYQNFGIQPDTLGRSWTIGLGGEWIPGKKGFLGGMIYRAGVNYMQTPIIINDEKINDVSFSVGLSAPIFSRDRQSFSLFNLSFIFGQRGNLTNHPIRDRYMKMNLGITINDKWFNKQKID